MEVAEQANNHTHIMIVEDEPIIALHIEEVLKGFGYKVVDIVPTGEQALEKVKDAKVDLVFMDIMLRGKMDGIDAAQRIRSYFDIPVVYLTAHSDPHILQRARVTEPYGYVCKPFNDRDLNIAVQMAVYKHQSERKTNSMRGMVPVCAWCKRIRDEGGYWKEIETYVTEHTGAQFSHCICPECLNDMTK